MAGIGDWTTWLWAWVDWVWAAGWILAGVLATHLFWWQRHIRLAEQEKRIREQMLQLGNRSRENRKQTEEVTRRATALKRMEESLRSQTEQLMPQIGQIRSWLNQVSPRGEATTGSQGHGEPETDQNASSQREESAALS